MIIINKTKMCSPIPIFCIDYFEDKNFEITYPSIKNLNIKEQKKLHRKYKQDRVIAKDNYSRWVYICKIKWKKLSLEDKIEKKTKYLNKIKKKKCLKRQHVIVTNNKLLSRKTKRRINK